MAYPVREEGEAVFTTGQVARLAGVSDLTLHLWDRTGFLVPSVARGRGTGSRRVSPFGDVVAARVAGEVRAAGVTPQALRAVLAWLRQAGAWDKVPADTYVVSDGREVWLRAADEVLDTSRRSPGAFAFLLNLASTVERLRGEIERLRSA
jgi:DNA-binding transcriptional MerR regulator